MELYQVIFKVDTEFGCNTKSSNIKIISESEYQHWKHQLKYRSGQLKVLENLLDAGFLSVDMSVINRFEEK